MTDEITQIKPTREKPSRNHDSSVATEESAIAPENKLPATNDASLQGRSKKLSERSEAERALKRSNPLEMPYDDVSQESQEYKDWRQIQHRHGIKNLILSLLVFGGLAILYWLFVHKA